MNNDGEISLEEAHVFQRALIGRLNTYVNGSGSVIDINSTPLDWNKYLELKLGLKFTINDLFNI